MPRAASRAIRSTAGEAGTPPALGLPGGGTRLCQIKPAINPIPVIVLNKFSSDNQVARLNSWRETSREPRKDNQAAPETVIEYGRRNGRVDFPIPALASTMRCAGEFSLNEFKPRHVASGALTTPARIRLSLFVDSEDDAGWRICHEGFRAIPLSLLLACKRGRSETTSHAVITSSGMGRELRERFNASAKNPAAESLRMWRFGKAGQFRKYRVYMIEHFRYDRLCYR